MTREPELAHPSDALSPEPERRYVAFGAESGGLPLAAIFRVRGSRRRVAMDRPSSADRHVAEAVARGRTTEQLAASDFDIVLTDAFQVEELDEDAGPFPALEEPEDAAVTAEVLAEPLGRPDVSLVGVESPTLPETIPEGVDPIWIQQKLLSEVEERARRLRTPAEGAWFSELFGPEYALGYPRRPPYAQSAEIDFIEASLDLVAGSRVLDLACGDGRHAIPLSRRGYEVVGVDLSIAMLERGLARTQPRDLPVKLVHGDMRDLRFNEVFDGACLLGTSLGFFTEVENLAVLRGVARAIKRGGRVLLQVANRDHVVQTVPNRAWWAGDGCLIQEDIEFDHRSSRLKVRRYTVFGDGRERTHDIDLRIYGAHELCQMAELIGLRVEEVSGAVQTKGAFFGAQSPCIWLTAVKP